MTKDKVIEALLTLENLSRKKGMSRFGINTENALGISMPALRSLAKQIGKNHTLAVELWQSPYHEARILATLIDEYKKVTPSQMNLWVSAFNSWDVCDQCCANLFKYTPFAYDKAIEWTASNVEYTKRAGFVMMACLAIGDKKAEDHKFLPFFELILRCSDDERNFVKKAVNWALRQLGKRNHCLRSKAIECIGLLLAKNNATALWIAKDALRELNDEKIIKRIKT